jgi:hypothetical protein
MRTIFGSQQVNVPSSFLMDISPEHIESSGKEEGGESGYERTIFID